MMKLYSIFAVLLLLFISTVQAQDNCLDPAAARYLVNQALNTQFPDPDEDSIETVISNLYNILRADSSAYALNLYVGYDSGHFISVQSCQTQSSAIACFYTTTGYFATVAGYGGDYVQRYYPVYSNGTANPANVIPVTGASYNVTSRPWYNANGWTGPYDFVNLATTGRTYEQTQSSTGAHVASDRLSTEPCTGPEASSPAILAATNLASSNNISVYGQRNATSLSDIVQFLGQLRSFVANFQNAVNGLASVGVGFESSSYFYSVTDCNGTPAAARPAECSNNRYYAEVRNEVLFGDANIQAYNFGTNTFRDSGNFFDTTTRPWFVIRNGWTDPYLSQTGTQSITSRTYAAAFNGGVAYADPNPAYPQDVVVCPTASATVVPSMVPSYSYSPSYSPPPSCGTPTPSPSGCVASPSPSGNGHDDSVTINFYFADILRQN